VFFSLVPPLLSDGQRLVLMENPSERTTVKLDTDFDLAGLG
jgi:hypothetical protein